MRRERGRPRWLAIGVLLTLGMLAWFPRPVAAPDYPYVMRTDPADDAYDIPVYLPIIVQFSKPMNRSNVVVRIVPDIALDHGG